MVSDNNHLYEELSSKVAQAIAEQLKQKPDSCFALPTGRSPMGCYSLLSQMSSKKLLDWSRAKCFALDDYLDIEEALSFDHFLQDHLYSHTNLAPQNCHNPRSVDDYDALIGKCGGLDLTILGLGGNGHIAFNEPGTPLDSWTHCIELTESTRQANESYFEEAKMVPFFAVTVGIATILASRKIILIASGEHKRDILEKAMSGKVDPLIPASFLNLNPNVAIVADFELNRNKFPSLK
jgi:glucosamine-6-phosphate deaminase